MSTGKDAGSHRPDSGLHGHYGGQEASARPPRRRAHRPPQHRRAAHDQAELAPAARGQHCGLSVPGAGISVREGYAEGMTLPGKEPTEPDEAAMLENLLAFEYQPLTRVVFGLGTLARLGELTRELGGRRVLLVTDPGLEQAGHPQRAVTYLQDAGLMVTVFDHVEENPTSRHVEAGLAVAQNEGIDFLVAVGGGSAMDTAKGINFLLTNGGKMADYWGTGKANKPMLPSIGVPTTAGTGSEAQSYALIADPESHIKMACGDKKAAFRVAILDPELTVSQPQRVTAFTGIDAVAHALETYVTTRRNPLAQLFAREAWRLLEKHVEVVLREPNNLAARAAMQLGAHYAGAAIENSMLGATH